MGNATAAPAAAITCTSCGHTFEPVEGEIACGTCVSKGGCGMVKCPRCGLEQARTPAFVERLLRFFRPGSRSGARNVKGADGAVTLACLRAGESAVVEKFLEPANVRKFLSLGILPGTQLTILRHTPVVVVRVGYSEFAFDHGLAGTLQVHRSGAERR